MNAVAAPTAPDPTHGRQRCLLAFSFVTFGLLLVLGVFLIDRAMNSQPLQYPALPQSSPLLESGKSDAHTGLFTNPEAGQYLTVSGESSDHWRHVRHLDAHGDQDALRSALQHRILAVGGAYEVENPGSRFYEIITAAVPTTHAGEFLDLGVQYEGDHPARLVGWLSGQSQPEVDAAVGSDWTVLRFSIQHGTLTGEPAWLRVAMVVFFLQGPLIGVICISYGHAWPKLAKRSIELYGWFVTGAMCAFLLYLFMAVSYDLLGWHGAASEIAGLPPQKPILTFALLGPMLFIDYNRNREKSRAEIDASPWDGKYYGFMTGLCVAFLLNVFDLLPTLY